MQTFLPYPDFRASARVLDTKRLGKQRVEAMQILRALTRETYGWKNHPAVLMWSGYEEALVAYALAVCDEWTARGHADTVATTIRTDLEIGTGLTTVRTQPQLRRAEQLPAWLGDDAFHRSHRATLLRKDPEHYRLHFPDDPDDAEPVWPVRKNR